MAERLVASVLCRGRFAMDARHVADALRGRLGAQAAIVCTAIPEGGGLLLQIDGIDIIVVYVGSPIPRDEFAPADMDLRDDVGRLVEHQDHAMISAFRDVQGREATLAAAMATLRVADVLCDAPGASAVFWQIARTLTGVAAFRAMLDPANGLPIGVLARFQPYRSSQSSGLETPLIGIAGYGFRRFVDRDIEFVPMPLPLAEMANRYFHVANWLLRHDTSIKDHDTCGISANEIIHINFKEPGEVISGPVISFCIERLVENQRGKF